MHFVIVLRMRSFRAVPLLIPSDTLIEHAWLHATPSFSPCLTELDVLYLLADSAQRHLQRRRRGRAEADESSRNAGVGALIRLLRVAGGHDVAVRRDRKPAELGEAVGAERGRRRCRPTRNGYRARPPDVKAHSVAVENGPLTE